MIPLSIRLHVVSVMLLFTCLRATAQVGTARLEGTIRDPSGAVVPGIAVSLASTRNQLTLQTSTTVQGIYTFPSLQPGIYTLTVQAPGFRQSVVSRLELTLGATTTQDIKLEVGEIAETIIVQAGTERTQASDAQIARAVTLRDIDVLPQLWRNPISLSVYSPGVQTRPGAAFLSTSVNGARQGSSNSRLDGIDVNDSLTPYLGFATTAFNTDSVEEFRIVTSGGKAEYGRNAGGQVELITRSGTNNWHGNAFEYHRNTALNANTFFNNSTRGRPLERPVFIQNRFGVSVGGPILRDRTFVFGNFQGLRTAQELSRNRRVLTAKAKQGIFRWIPQGSSKISEYDIFSHDPVGLDRQVRDILEQLPEPNNYDIGDNLNIAGYRFNNLATENQQDGYDDQFTFRADHNLRRDNRLFFRYTRRRNRNVDNVGPTDATFPGQPYGIADAWGWGFSIGSDWAISARLVNELRFGYKFYHLNLDRHARLPGPMMVSNLWTDPLDPTFSAQREPPVRHITENVTFLRNKHTIKVGIEARVTSEWKSQDEGIWPNIYFSPSFAKVDVGPKPPGISKEDRATFEKLYNNLLGRVSHITQTFHSDLENMQETGTPRVRTHRFREFGGFFQDGLETPPPAHAEPRLTVRVLRSAV